jgi:hypothetical protein
MVAAVSSRPAWADLRVPDEMMLATQIATLQLNVRARRWV